MKIIPTAEAIAAGITVSDYTVRMGSQQLSYQTKKIVQSSRTISGDTSISVFRVAGNGETITINATLNNTELARLKRVADSTYNEWLVVSSGRVYRAVVAIESTERNAIRADRTDVNVALVIIEEETNK
jgi:hypothetical protein